MLFEIRRNKIVITAQHDSWDLFKKDKSMKKVVYVLFVVTLLVVSPVAFATFWGIRIILRHLGKKLKEELESEVDKLLK